MDKPDIDKLIKEYQDGKHGPLAEEVKVVILTFQAVPPGMSPYFVLVGRPQTINENSQFTLEGEYLQCISFYYDIMMLIIMFAIKYSKLVSRWQREMETPVC
jgi:hypothetical protein